MHKKELKNEDEKKIFYDVIHLHLSLVELLSNLAIKF